MGAVRSHLKLKLVISICCLVLAVQYLFFDKWKYFNVSDTAATWNSFDYQRLLDMYPYRTRPTTTLLKFTPGSDADTIWQISLPPVGGNLTSSGNFSMFAVTSNFSAPSSNKTTSTIFSTTSLNFTTVSNIDVVTSASIGNQSDSVARFSRLNTSLELCPLLPPKLVGPIKVWFDYPTWPELHRLYAFLEAGGHGKPETCISRHRVAIVLPYRNREEHLRAFLHNLHSLLTKQQLDYGIFVVEQIANQTFNRAKLMNVGFAEAMKLYDWQCFIFHDVDLFPEDDRNIYSCPEQPRHMSVAIDKFGYKLPYSEIFGGISALTVDQFKKINGFSNDYWGWGGEDDDMASRVRIHNYQISRYSSDIARYKMIKHHNEKTNPVNTCRYSLMYKVHSRWKQDGLSSLNYRIDSTKKDKLFTWFLVDLLEDESRKRLDAEKVCK